ncbi:hypothetical protein [Sphaerisporangium sp. TRM90804]|uniref:hypothetical protein n=1 Tax=Sphaerisporangium sp. TRM90804 TaxID=3031113 RepID=UPI00244D313B|nr:hypothetical protein [Sphaerisporangium sp. TRM90804]MDH2427014.1 hypothetical protein [Sphaerisporangium sp. TRM90804]
MAPKIPARIQELTQWLDKMHHVDPDLIEELILSTSQIRLFRKGARGVETDLLIEPVIRALGEDLLREHSALVPLMKGVYKQFQLAVRHPGKASFAVDELLELRRAWQPLKAELSRSEVEDAGEFARWFDQEVEEMTAIVRRGGTPGRAPRKGVQAAPRKVSREDARAAYKVFTGAMADSSPATFVLMQQLSFFFRPSDPIWLSMAEAVASTGVKNVDALAVRIQGILGEGLALRHPWVLHLMSEGARRAQRLAGLLGPEWKIVFVEGAAYASKTSGAGLGQLYDGSIWIVRKGQGGEPLEAAPVWVLEVKSGRVSEAMRQIAKGFVRELDKTVRLPRPDGSTAECTVRSLRALLGDKADLVKDEIGEASTQRVLVAPRAPGDRSVRHLPKGVAVDYIMSFMSQRDMRTVSRALAAAHAKVAR